MIVPIVIVATAASLATLGYKKLKAKKYNISVGRELVFNRAMSSLQDPIKLQKLATTFKQVGLISYAERLEQRAEEVSK